MGLFGFFLFFSRNPSAGHTMNSSSSHPMLPSCKHLHPAPVLSPGLPCPQILRLLRASKCWTGATWAIYFISWYALSVEKLRQGGLERNFCYTAAWPQLLQRTDDSENWGLLQQMWHGNFCRKWTLAPEFSEAHLTFLNTMYSADEIADWFFRNHSLLWW